MNARRWAQRRVAAVGFAAAACAVAGPAAAAPRAVVLVNLAADQPAGARAVAGLRTALGRQVDLEPISRGELARGLERALSPQTAEEAASEATAAEAMTTAADRIARFDYGTALRRLRAAEDALASVPPTPERIALLAEINFQAGRVYLAINQPDNGVAAFRVTRRLAPEREALDPARYRPDIVAAFDRAATPLAASVSVRIATPFDGATVTIDGRVAGRTPLDVTLEPGTHYVFATRREYAPVGVRVDVSAAGANVTLPLDVRLASPAAAVQLRRATLAEPPPIDDAAAQRAFADNVAELASAPVVVIVRGASPLLAAVYDRAADTFSVWLPIGRHTAWALIAHLPEGNASKVAGAGVPFEIPPPPPPPPGPSWYQTTWGKLALGGGVAGVLSVVGAILITSQQPIENPRNGAGNNMGPGFF